MGVNLLDIVEGAFQCRALIRAEDLRGPKRKCVSPLLFQLMGQQEPVVRQAPVDRPKRRM